MAEKLGIQQAIQITFPCGETLALSVRGVFYDTYGGTPDLTEGPFLTWEQFDQIVGASKLVRTKTAKKGG
jgi:hypothetical protein